MRLPDTGTARGTRQFASRDCPRVEEASWYGAAAGGEDIFWGTAIPSSLILVFLFSFQLLHRWQSGQSDGLPENAPVGHTV